MTEKKARRVTFTLLKDKTYHLLFSVIEILYSDFQDYDDYSDGFVCKRINHTEKGSNEKIYFSIDFPEITEELLSNPSKDFIFEDDHHTPVECNGQYNVYPPVDDCRWVINHYSSPEILKVLPERNDTRYLRVWKSRSSRIADHVLNSPDLLRQLSELSRLHYGVDLANYLGVLGSIYIVGYNPYYRNLELSMSEAPAGMYLKAQGIRRNDEELRIAFVNKNKEGWYEYFTDAPFDLSRTHHFFPLRDAPDRIEILVKDHDGQLIDAIPPIPFVKAFHVGMNIASSRLSITHGDNTSEEVQKYVGEHFEVTPKSGDDAGYASVGITPIVSPQGAYEALEQGLEFVFFDGSKDPTERAKNKDKAKGIVRKILGRARRSCMIADPYFNLNDLSHYIFTMSQSNVVVRVLGSTEFLNSSFGAPHSAATVEKEREEIRKSIASYMSAYPRFNVQFRLLTGKCPLHDRYIVVDDDVWFVGTSFNEIGGRASSIIKLPGHSGSRVRKELEEWWSDASKCTPA